MNRLKFLLASVIIFTFILSTNSCKDEGFLEVKDDNIEERSKSAFIDLDIGEKHNYILDLYFTSFNSSGTNHSPDSILSRTITLLETSIGNTINCVQKNKILSQYYKIYPICNKNLAKTFMLNSIDTLKYNVPSNLNLVVFDTLKSMIINNNYNLNKLESLAAISVNSTAEKEIIYESLSILKQSENYWKNDTNLSDDDVQAIVELDCAGYMLAWGNSVYAEIRNNGHLSEGNANDRIVAGLAGAAGASLGGKKWWSF